MQIRCGKMGYKRGDWIPSNKNTLGKIIRLPLRLIPKGTIVPILRSAARGKKWIIGSGANSLWMGISEIRKKKHFEKTVQEGSIVYDIGANVGIYTILSSVLCGKSGQVFAFEPDPHNIRYLKDHIKLNKLQNVSIVEKALSNSSGRLFFQATSDHCQSHISENGEIEIESITLDDFVAKDKNHPPDVVKIDVEGAENLVIEGAHKTLSQHKPVLFLATHSIEVDQNCRKQLEKLNYTVSKIRGYDDELYCVPK